MTTVPDSLSLSASARELARSFDSLRGRADVASLLDVREKDLIYYSVRLRRRYKVFQVRKRSRRLQYRVLREPVSGLKIIQQKLLQVLGAVYRAPECVHGFVAERSIATNAGAHEGQRYLVNIDLKEFFNTINFGRVWGLLQAKPYSLPRPVATLITQLCMEDNALPQGAPTSPILSNMVALGLDRALQRLASRRNIRYTRYADDLTFSSDRPFPSEWLRQTVGEEPHLTIGGPIRATIEAQGFNINESKVRFRALPNRLEVTGLIVNQRVNVTRSFVRSIRSMLYAWEKYGEESAVAHWKDPKDRNPAKQAPRFKQVVAGKICFLGMVRGLDDPLYDRFYLKFCDLAGVSPRAPHNRNWNHIRRTADAIWVLESGTSGRQGTAFFLEGHGLVTCEHVLADDTEAFPPARPTARFPVQVIAKDRDLDLAILGIEVSPPTELKAQIGGAPKVGDEIVLRAYPDYNAGSSMWESKSAVSGFRYYENVRRLTIASPIAKGMSGGPVFNRMNVVVGIAATDANLYNSVIPVDELWTLRGKAGLD